MFNHTVNWYSILSHYFVIVLVFKDERANSSRILYAGMIILLKRALKAFPNAVFTDYLINFPANLAISSILIRL